MSEIDLFGVRKMLAVIEEKRGVKRFLSDLAFPGSVTHETEQVDVDIVVGTRKLAPIVHYSMPGSMQERTEFSTNSVSPPYVKPKRIVKPTAHRMPGEIIYGSQPLSPAQRAAMQLGKNIAEMDEEISRLEEWMAAQALSNGSVHLVGKGINMIVDFQMAADHKVTLAAADKLTATTSKPLSLARAWSRKILQDSGVRPGWMVLGQDCFEPFIDRLASSGGELDTRRIDLGKIDPDMLPDGAEYLGFIKGINMDIYTYDEWYVDRNGDEQPMVKGNEILVGSSRTRNARLYGAIKDVEAMAAVPRFPKSWIQPDPSARIVMLQSAPLMAMLEPNAFMKIKARDAVT